MCVWIWSAFQAEEEQCGYLTGSAVCAEHGGASRGGDRHPAPLRSPLGHPGLYLPPTQEPVFLPTIVANACQAMSHEHIKLSENRINCFHIKTPKFSDLNKLEVLFSLM